MRNSLFFLVTVILLSGCKAKSIAYRKAQLSYVDTCTHDWVYSDLKEDQKLKVLRYQAQFHYDMSSFPGWVIGVTQTNDTIIVLDPQFHGPIKVNQMVKATPLQWSDLEKNLLRPTYSISSKPAENRLYCSVHHAYYGLIVSEK